VLTGIFPEIGGGSGLSLGKDRLKAIIESFGIIIIIHTYHYFYVIYHIT
jgi:hypothetical protein